MPYLSDWYSSPPLTDADGNIVSPDQSMAARMIPDELRGYLAPVAAVRGPLALGPVFPPDAAVNPSWRQDNPSWPASGLDPFSDQLLRLAMARGGRQTYQGQAQTALQAAPASSALPSPSWYMDPNDFHAQFYRDNYAAAAKALAPYNVDPALALGLAANESNWGRNPNAQAMHNPFGYKSSDTLQTFLSPEQAWQRWASEYGPKVQGVGSDADTFVRNLQMNGVGSNGKAIVGPMPGGIYQSPYNSERLNPPYDMRLLSGIQNGKPVPGTIPSVRATLPRWLGNLDAMP